MTNASPLTMKEGSDTSPKLLGVIGFLVLVEFVSGLLQGFYDPLQKLFAIEYQVGDAQITWFHAVQSLSAAISVPLLAKLGDMFGHRRILRIAVVVVLIGTLLTAFAPNFAVLLVSRIFTGPIAVWLPLEIALVHHRVSGERARRTIGILVSVLTLGAVVGTILSGVIISCADLSLALLLPPVFISAALYAVMFRIPESPTRSAPGIDGLGLAGLAGGMVLLLLGMSQIAHQGLRSGLAWALIGGALAVLSAWVLWERRTAYPAVDIRMLACPRLAPLYIAGFLFGCVLFGFQSPLTTFAASDPVSDGYGLGLPTVAISIVIAVFTILTSLGAASFTLASHRIGMKKVLVTGAGLAACGFGFFAVEHSAAWTVFVLAVPAGIGMGLLMGSLPALIAENAPDASTGIATGVYNSLRTLGGSMAGALFGIILTVFAQADGSASDGGYTLIWVIAAVCFALAGIVLAIRKPDPTPGFSARPTPTGTMAVVENTNQ
ncbi:MFS transporter [Arthrobacter sp. M4]|uniref:MFS transporter n=1 Tax=Arthrobacter sp. M4 TaxID=218160 RepID=UPI001CDB6D56|nr:MFS transporter [Arthrobacter sp. M4]MCA4135290.1 MFS transporter [Arthrobacter sp. M4]